MNKMKRLFTIWFWLYVLSFSIGSYAGIISLETTATASANDQWLEVNLSVKNLGNETAENTTLSINAAGKLKTLASPVSLTAGATIQQQIRLQPTPYPQQGRHYLPLTIRYTDGNGYLFEVVQMIEIIHGINKNTELRLQTKPLQLPRQRTLSLNLENNGLQAKEVHLTCWLPMGVTCKPLLPIKIPAQSQMEVNLELSYEDIWPGNYLGYILVNVPDPYSNFSEISAIHIEVKQKSTWIQWLFQPVVLTFFLLISLVVSLLMSHRRKDSHHA